MAVVAKGDKANEARAAGADFVGAEDLVERIQKESWTDFDSMVATPDMMGLVGRLGRVLGPKGLMPNPKVGTVTTDVAKAVRELKAGRVEFRVEKAGIVHARIGKASFGSDKLRGERTDHGRDPAAAQTGIREGDLYEVGDPINVDGTGNQGRHRAAGFRVRNQVGTIMQETNIEHTEKREVIGALKADLAKAASLVLADFRGLTVKVDTGLRREFRVSGCRYQVVKNTLLGLAVKGTPMEGIESLLVGPTAIAYSFEDPAAPAKVASKIAKAEEKFIIKGGYVEGRALDAKGVEALSNLPGKRRAACDFPCNFAGRASELRAPAQRGAPELRVPAGRARGRFGRSGNRRSCCGT